MFLETPWSRPPCLTAFFTMRPSSRSRGRAIDFASTPISCRKTSDRKASSNHRRSRRLSNVADGRQKAEASIKTTPDHPTRQTGEFYFAIIGEIPRAIDRLAWFSRGAVRAGAQRRRDDRKRRAHSGVRPAPSVAGVPPATGIAQGGREQQRHLAGARARGWAPSHCGAARPVRRDAAKAFPRCTRADAQLLAVGRAQCRALSRERQAGSPRRGRRLHRREAAGRRRGGRERGAGRIHASTRRRARRSAERGHRGDPRARNAPRVGGRGIAEGSLVDTWRPRPPRACFAAETRTLLKALAHGHSHVRYSSPDPEDRPGVDFDAPGRLDMRVLQELGVPRNGDFYIFGPGAFMSDLTAGLAAWGIAASRIHIEIFGAGPSNTPGVAASPRRPPHLPAGPPGAGPLVSFARSGINVRWGAAL